MAKTLIAVLASRDSIVKNNELARVFETLYEYTEKNICAHLDDFHFILCGGTFSRLFRGIDQIDNHIISSGSVSRISWDEPPKKDNDDPKELAKFTEKIFPINENVRKYLLGQNGEPPKVTAFPNHIKGGVTLISNLIVQRQCNIVWPFFSPITEHWTRPENLAMLRLCDLWNAKRLMNAESVRSWWINEANKDAKLYQQEVPIKFRLFEESPEITNAINTKSQDLEDSRNKKVGTYYKFPFDEIRNLSRLDKKAQDYYFNLRNKTVALIAPDSMKSKMVDFVLQYENEFAEFKRIIATENTGEIIEQNCRRLRKKIDKCLPGPRGGNIEISTEILFNRCNIVIFLVDPLHPHPHIDDIRVVFGSCMAEMKDNDVRILTSEVQAREWIEGVIQHNVLSRNFDITKTDVSGGAKAVLSGNFHGPVYT